MRDQALVTYQVMLNAKEESGFYEIPDDLASLLPDNTREERIKVAKVAIRDFFTTGLIEVWVAEWPREIVRQASAHDIDELLEDSRTWQMVRENNRTYLFAVLSDAGQQAWTNANFS